MSQTSTSIAAMLEVRDLRARIDDREILKGMSLTVNPGEVHAIMGPNGSGKSTFAGILAGKDRAQVTGGTATLDGKDLLAMAPEERAVAGLFLGFQYPVEIPGVGNMYFLRTSLNAQRRARGEEELDAVDFLGLAREKMKLVEMDPAFMNRGVNEGFSGGEKKRNEVLQMAVLEPRLAILDEIDSGLDIDALRVVAKGVEALRSPARSTLLVTHYQRLLEYIVPDHIHVMAAGRIVLSGGRELALELEKKGYAWVDEEAKRGAFGAPAAVTP
jgi:Fe-S cluster assembly ATP-binding protein